MDEETRGKTHRAAGKVQASVGELPGDRELKTEGRLRQAEGEAEQDVARAEAKLKEAATRRASARRLRRSS